MTARQLDNLCNLPNEEIMERFLSRHCDSLECKEGKEYLDIIAQALNHTDIFNYILCNSSCLDKATDVLVEYITKNLTEKQRNQLLDGIFGE